MHLLTLSAPVNLGSTVGVLTAGEWLLNDVNSFEIASLAPRGTATLEQFDPCVMLRRSCPGDELTEDASVLIVRSGAWGDLLLLEPALRAYKEKYPKRRVALACFPHHLEMVVTWAEHVRYPVPVSALHNFDEVIDLENAECDRETHMTDVFAKKLGVTVTDYKPRFLIANPRMRPKTNSKRPVVGICPAASVANRSYPLDKFAHLIDALLQAEWEIWIFGRKGQMPEMKPNPRIRDLTRESESFQDTASWLNICDAFIGVDSALIHLCHALEVPAVGLYAAFPWQIRTAKAPKTHAVSGNGKCSPCFWHMHAGQQFPPTGPCAKTGFCTVLADIKIDRIIGEVNKLKP